MSASPKSATRPAKRRVAAPPESFEEPELPEIVWISAEDAWAEFDRESRRRLGMPGEEVLSAFERGDFDERIEEEDILTLFFMQRGNPATAHHYVAE